MATATYNGKQVYSQDRSTTYWFTLNGEAYGTREFESEEYGISEQWADDEDVDEDDLENCIVDCDGAPLTEGDFLTIAIRNTIEITDEMRQSKKEV